MEIKLAGAGAGKTTKLAEDIILANEKSNGNIYCVSYTNSSSDIIYKKLLNYYDNSIPTNIKVSTISSFLYSELIQPFNYFLYGIDYKHVIDVPLSQNFKYKNGRLKQLRNSDLLHVKEIPKTAKYILKDKTNDKKAIKNVRTIIKSFIRQYFSIIFVDEAQDINEHFRDILLELNKIGIPIKLIGDKNQDIGGTNSLNDLIDKLQVNPEVITENYRCSSQHIKLSNLCLNENEKQYSPSDKIGDLNIAFQDDIVDIKNYIKQFGLTYIYQKNGIFNTQIKTQQHYTYDELKVIIGKSSPLGKETTAIKKWLSRNTVNLIKSVINDICTPKQAAGRLFPYGKIDKKEFIQLVEALTADTDSLTGKKSNNEISVRSIHDIKGLENKNCLFIITNALMPYLLREKNNTKMNSLLYVGLTRSCKDLTLLFTNETIGKFGKNKIKSIIENLE